jgi:NAD(P)-dependent dehydrogenase (short-subunit alcohol dehydrogenase family)
MAAREGSPVMTAALTSAGHGADARPVAVVTGANRGIGREVARQLAGRGFLVVAGSRDLEAGERTARQIDPAGGNVIARRLDVTDPATLQAAAGWTAEHCGRADVLVNNAAIHYDTWQQAQNADLAVVREALDTNLLGAWRTTQAFLPLLRRSAHARIVNVSSEGGSISGMTGGTPAYSVSKAALNALTRLLAGELRAGRILVNAVCPGWTDTDMGRGGRPVAEGAASVMWAVLLPDEGPTGGFYRDGLPLPW